MSEDAGGARPGGDPSTQAPGGELMQRRDAFLQTFFRRGAELAEELAADNRRLHDKLAEARKDNASLRTQLESDRAIAELLRKIDELEREKARLLSAVNQQSELTNRYTELEGELESFANLHVAAFQLHASLRAPRVLDNLKELLVQLVGASSIGVYFTDESGHKLLPIQTFGAAAAAAAPIVLHATRAGSPEAVIEHAYLTGVPHIEAGRVSASPAACIPLRIEDRTVGAVVVYALLPHKTQFVPVDRELFKLLGAQAAGALVAAHLWTQAEGRLPSPQALLQPNP